MNEELKIKKLEVCFLHMISIGLKLAHMGTLEKDVDMEKDVYKVAKLAANHYYQSILKED